MKTAEGQQVPSTSPSLLFSNLVRIPGHSAWVPVRWLDVWLGCRSTGSEIKPGSVQRNGRMSGLWNDIHAECWFAGLTFKPNVDP